MLDHDRDTDWARLLHAIPSRSRGDYTLRGAYRLLGALFVVAVAVAWLWSDTNRHVERFAPNAATEIFGIIITLAFVHRLLYRQERARRMRASIGAFRRANWTLTQLARVWADVVKGCHRGEELPRTLPRLFAPHVVESIISLDVQRLVPGDDEMTWGGRLQQDLERSVSELNNVILSYGAVLDPAYTEAIDELIDHPFVKLVAELAGGRADAATWRVRIRTQRGHVEDFFQHLLQTIALHNALAAEAAATRSRSRAPRSGTLGMELERDHDLRINTELSSAWRSAAPAAGSLCA